MSKLYDEKFKEKIKEKIRKGKFAEKQDLINYISGLSNDAVNNPEIASKLEQEGVEVNSNDLADIVKELLEYYDKTKTNTASLNLENVSVIDIEDKNYLKVNNGDDSYTILDDSMTESDFVTQFQDRQNSSFNYQTKDGVKNREAIIEDMKKDKVEVTLESSTQTNVRDLSPEERREFAAVMRLPDSDEINFLVDPERNIYINKDTGETFYTHRTSDGKLEVRSATEKKAETLTDTVNSVDELGNEVEVNVESVSNLSEFEALDSYELEMVVNNKLDSLTPEQQAKLKEMLARKKAEEKAKVLEKENVKDQALEMKPKTLIKQMQKPYNGFLSLMFLCLIVSLLSTSILLYIIISNGLLG